VFSTVTRALLGGRHGQQAAVDTSFLDLPSLRGGIHTACSVWYSSYASTILQETAACAVQTWFQSV